MKKISKHFNVILLFALSTFGERFFVALQTEISRIPPTLFSAICCIACVVILIVFNGYE